MRDLFNRITVEPELLILPILMGIGTIIGLLIILRFLQRNSRAHGINTAYLFGTLALSVWVFADQLTQASQIKLPGLLSHSIQAALLIFWSYVILELLEDVILARWTTRSGITIPRLARDIVRGLVFIIVGLLVLALLFNIDPGSIAISSTVISAVLGLALQDLLKNVIAGVALQIERPFEVGHWIQVEQIKGRVIEMNWRATHLLSADGHFVIYPNSGLAESTVFNYSLPEKSQATHLYLSVEQKHDPEEIKALLHKAMLSSSEVLEKPAPSVSISSYAEDHLSYDLKFWLRSYDQYAEQRDAVLSQVWKALQEADISSEVSASSAN